MKKYFFSLTLFTFCFLSFSQSGTSSPYSFYGVGINTFKGSIDNRSMGGLSLYTDSIHLNLTNPASYSQLRRTNYSLGITYDNTSLKHCTFVVWFDSAPYTFYASDSVLNSELSYNNEKQWAFLRL